MPVGRVLELVYQRLEQQDHEEMRKQIRLGGAFVDPRRPFEADQAFEPFECEFNAPSETIKCEDVGRREDLGPSEVTRMTHSAARSVPFEI